MRDMRFVFGAVLTLLVLMVSGRTALSFECKPGEVLGPGRAGSAHCFCKGQQDCDALLASQAGNVCKLNFECPPGADVCSCPIGPSINLHAAHDAFCQDYATKAVTAAKENVELRCGNAGPRWTVNFNEHDDWCKSLEDQEGPPNAEAAARASALQACREQIARRGEIVQKPNIPIGDLTKPVTPPPSEPLPPGGTGNFLKQMKP